jgi:hypothetical protein
MKSRVQTEESLAHITQAETEALKESDAAVTHIEEFVKKAAEEPPEPGIGSQQPKPVLKTKRVVEPAKLMTATYLETKDDVDHFLDALRQQLEQAIDNDERIEIR